MIKGKDLQTRPVIILLIILIIIFTSTVTPGSSVADENQAGKRKARRWKAPGSEALMTYDQNWNPAETPKTAYTPISLSVEQGKPATVVQESSRLMKVPVLKLGVIATGVFGMMNR